MAKKHLSKDAILSIEQDLQSVDTQVQTKFNIKQTIERLFPHIERMRSLNLEWQEISDRIHTAMSQYSQTHISPKTLQNYYNEIARKRKSQPQSKVSSRKRSHTVEASEALPNRKITVSPREQISAGIVPALPGDPDLTSIATPAIDRTTQLANISDQMRENNLSNPAESEPHPVEDETTIAGTILEDLSLDDATIDPGKKDDDHSTKSILEELGLDDDATEAPRNWVEPEFNHMRVTFDD